MQSFNEDVIEASKTKPVLVDFWAPWCGPCRVLGPVLDRVVEENGEKVTLVKVNTDDSPALSQEYGIRGIPAVKLFVEGKVAAEFTGALPEHEVRKWLQEHLPSAAKTSIDEAAAKEAAGDINGAIAFFETALEDNPEAADALAALARLRFMDDPEKAKERIEKAVDLDPRYIHLSEPIETLSRLVKIDIADLPQNGEASEHYKQAITSLKEAEYNAAVESFMNVLKTDRYFDDDGSRKACVALFVLLGPAHEVTQKHRRMFDMLLY